MHAFANIKTATLLVILITSSVAIAFEQNILLIVVDDLRTALGCYKDENAYTPHIDKLAHKSILFRNAYVQQALCAPSRNSFLTSRRPDTLHLYDFYSYWRTTAGNFTTIPQFFKDRGFHTKSIGKIFHPGISSNGSDDQPYSWSEEPFHPPTELFKEAPVCLNKEHGILERNIVCPVVVKFQPGHSLPDLQSLDKAKEFLRCPLKKPFFLAVGFHKPHIPLKFPREYLAFHPLDKVTLAADRWHPYGMPTVAWNPWSDLRKRDDISALNLTFPFEPIPDDYSRRIRQSYYAAVTYIDHLIGQLLVELEQVGKAKNTSILLIGDNGWSMGEHGEWSKYSNFDVSVRVPFILHVPNLTDRGIVSKELVELVDIFPTLVDMANLPALAVCPKESNHIALCTEGSSIMPLLQNSVCQWKKGAFSQYPRPGLYPMHHPDSDKPRLSSIKIMGYSLRTRRHRFTEWVQFDITRFQPIWSNILATELYDHHLDPEENVNMFDRKEMSAIVHRLRKQLRAGWRSSLPVSE